MLPKSFAFFESQTRWIVPIVVSMAFFIEQFNNAALIVAMPVIATDFGRPALQLSWLITAYVISVVLVMPTSAWFADRFGARRIFMAALAIFALGSLGSAFAGSFESLLMWRIVQGIGGAWMTPVGRVIMLRCFSREELVAAMGLMTAPVLFGPLLGPVFGGLVTEYGAWQWLFLANIVVMAVAIAGAFAVMPPDRARDRAMAFDGRGYLMLAPVILTAQLFISIGNNPVFLMAAPVLVVMAAGMVLAYRRHLRRSPQAPILDVTLLRVPSFFMGTLIGGICRIGFNAAPYLLPLYFQIVHGMRADLAGTLVAMAVLGSLIAKPFNGALLRRFGFKGVLSGTALGGAVLISSFAFYDPAVFWIMAVPIFLLGALQTLQYNTLNILTYVDISEAAQAAASGLGGIIHHLAMGASVSLSALALSILSISGVPDYADFMIVFLLAASFPVVAVGGYLLGFKGQGER